MAKSDVYACTHKQNSFLMCGRVCRAAVPTTKKTQPFIYMKKKRIIAFLKLIFHSLKELQTVKQV